MNTLPARILPHYTRPTPDEIPDLESAGNSSGFYSSIGAEPRGTIAPLRCTLPAQAAYDATGDMAYGLEIARGVGFKRAVHNRRRMGIAGVRGRDIRGTGTQTCVTLSEDPTARITDRTREGEVIVVRRRALCKAHCADRHPHVPVLAAVRLMQGEIGRRLMRYVGETTQISG